MVGTPDDVFRTRARGRDTQLCTGVALAATRHLVGGRGVIGHLHVVAIHRLEDGVHAGGRASRAHDLRGVGVIGGHEDKSGFAILLGPALRHRNGLVQIVQFANLTAGIRPVISLINRGGFHLEEESGVVLEQIHGLLGHGRQGGNISGPGFVNRAGFIGCRLARGGHRLVEHARHIARGEKAENRLILVGFGQGSHLLRRRHNLEVIITRVSSTDLPAVHRVVSPQVPDT